MFMAGLSPSMRQTLLKHVYTLYIHVYVIWSGFQMVGTSPAVQVSTKFLGFGTGRYKSVQDFQNWYKTVQDGTRQYQNSQTGTGWYVT